MATLRQVTQQLSELAKLARGYSEPLGEEQAAALWRGLSDAGKALRKAGYPRPRAAPRRPTPDPAQLDFFDAA